MSNEAFTRNFNIANNTEEFIYNDTKVYLMPALAAAGAFVLAALVRVVMWGMFTLGDYNPYIVTAIATVGILVVAGFAIYLAAKLFGLREFVNSELLLKKQAVASGIVTTIFFLLAMWENFGEWMFGAITIGYFILGAVGLALTWAIRRWSDKRIAKMPVEEPKISFWEEMGYGSTSSAGSERILGGYRHKVKLDPKKTTEDLIKDITLVAKKYETSPKKLRIQEMPGNPNYAFITELDEEPFSNVLEWKGPDKPGANISEPIDFASYDIGTRANLYLSGKNGDSCFSWLTTGMPGSGKTYAWQLIYGTVLARKEVSLVWIDASKGIASMLPLADGIEWFAGNMEDAHQVISNVDRSIKARMSYLTQKGYTYWKPGCGINFIILHVEEASDFVKTESEEVLRHIARAGRSAGVIVVYSLQRATNDNMPTSLRANLEGKMAFKIGKKTERQFCLSDKQLGAGAAPESIAVKGGFYFDSIYEPSELAGNMARTDWMDERDLERAVTLSAEHRTPLDNITAAAFGMPYDKYRTEVANGTTEWQVVRAARDGGTHTQEGTFKAPESDSEAPTEEIKTETPKKNKAANFNADTQTFIDALWNCIEDYAANVNSTFSKKDIVDLFALDSGKSPSWIYKQMKNLVDEGKLEDNAGELRIK